MTAANRFSDEWDCYRRDFLPGGAGPVQRRETRLAFYAGAEAVMRMIPARAKTADIVAINEELRSFLDSLQDRSKP